MGRFTGWPQTKRTVRTRCMVKNKGSSKEVTNIVIFRKRRDKERSEKEIKDEETKQERTRIQGQRRRGSRPLRNRNFTSPKAPRPITFSISKSSLCSRMSFTVVVNGFTEDRRHTLLSY